MEYNYKKNSPKRYQHLFLGYCFSCNNFGHKALHCRTYGKKNHKNVLKDMIIRTTRIIIIKENRNYNSFSPLQDYNVECWKCNNYGHKASECRLKKFHEESILIFKKIIRRHGEENMKYKKERE
jgi:hypothetical protein